MVFGGLLASLDQPGKCIGSNSGNEESFPAGRVAGEERDLRFPQAERFGKQLDHGFVGLAFLGRLGDADFQLTVLNAANFVTPSAGMDADREDYTVGMRFEREHGCQGRKCDR